MSNTVLITGASTGIGAACAIRLAAAGMHVYAGVREDAAGAALRAQNAALITPLHLDVTDAESIAAAVATLEAQLGEAGLNGLVNNAGIAIAARLKCCRCTRYAGNSTSMYSAHWPSPRLFCRSCVAHAGVLSTWVRSPAVSRCLSSARTACRSRPCVR